ncbi:gluconate operon transcriptional repressor GntR [Vibrio plantisponsor]|jgi:LacI family gluconate utilization system Gnt-I transcriptional repressor|uniref:LacI family transcriptional regulator n=2 Tax=Vibrio TaxID=662 RepID=A0A2J8GK05_VIBDI|nr:MULTISPECIES: gluconate operon transcriptional repressor GntR [Vibrio]MDW6017229.1 gluconate operon transcriptional repressor GntR [Vibrio plantisponsor]NNM40171.1 gluconate operon transcriptional repressor GntR [Vibrio plantisponsor]PNH86332.1 transcriptional regulator [Vibrio diazotrophicus]RAS63429.1 LacI family transcriptional regulator [Vibrio diazotrophicus]
MVSKKKRPTLQDVANLVGVTKMTVSRCLRDPNSVSPAVQEKVLAAVEELGYIPNRAPDILSNAKSHAIGVLVPSLTNQVFAEVIRGIEQVTGPAGYQTMLAHYGYSSELEEQSVASLLSYNVDAIILSENVHTERVKKMLQTASIPVVEIMDSISPRIEQAVGFDNFAAAKDMTKAMLAKGCKQIVYLAARMDERTRQKMSGFNQAMSEAGLEPLALQTEAASSFTLGAKLLGDAIEKYPKVDGIFCTNDDLAIGAFYECVRRKISVPNQISIAGFHGHDISQAMTPRLATVVTPREKIGQIAAREIMNRLNGEKEYQECIDLGYRIELGESI